MIYFKLIWTLSLWHVVCNLLIRPFCITELKKNQVCLKNIPCHIEFHRNVKIWQLQYFNSIESLLFLWGFYNLLINTFCITNSKIHICRNLSFFDLVFLKNVEISQLKCFNLIEIFYSKRHFTIKLVISPIIISKYKLNTNRFSTIFKFQNFFK